MDAPFSFNRLIGIGLPNPVPDPVLREAVPPPTLHSSRQFMNRAGWSNLETSGASSLKRIIVAGALALAGFACAARSWPVPPECIDARKPLDAVLESESADTSQAPREVVHTDTPRLIDPPGFDQAKLNRQIRRLHPLHLRQRGIGGTTLVHALISQEGCVATELVAQSSSLAELDSLALRLVRGTRFTPGKRGGLTVEVWIELPITFFPPP